VSDVEYPPAAVERDDTEAEAWFRRAADQGVAAAAFELGCAEERRGDLTAAEAWYRRAADGGHGYGTLNLGTVLEKRGAVSAAVDVYRRAWELGVHEAAFNLGRIHDDDGRGDQATAAEWYERAADRGNAGAAFNLGHVRGDQGDTDAQLETWQRAVDLGHPRAAHGLGLVLLRRGEHDAGIAWLRRAAAEFGDEAAADRLAGILDHRGERDEANFWRELPRGLRAYSPRFEAFASEGSAAAIHRQHVLDDALGAGDVRFNLDDRTWTANGRVCHGLTSLGTFSHLTRSWLWAWHNEDFRPDHPAVEPLRAIRDHGRRHDIPELTIGRLDLSGFPNPHRAATTIAVAAAALLGGNGVRACRINNGKGTAYFHLDDPQLPVAEYDPLSAADVVMAAAEAFPNNHRRVVQGFVSHYGARIAVSGDVLRGEFPGGHRLSVAFTSDGLVKAITSDPGASRR
jgi:tetratricopeptide (TPR) repeat protein